MSAKEMSAKAAWRPEMPRAGKSILLDALELVEQQGWCDEAVAAIHAARDAGWTLVEIGDVLGVSREYVRQLYQRDVDPVATVEGFPAKPPRPKRPKKTPIHVMRRRLVSDEEISELIALHLKATRRRRDANPVAVKAAEELYERVHRLVTIGVSVTWLSRRMELNQNTLKQGLWRYGYATPPPSQRNQIKVHSRSGQPALTDEAAS